MQTSSEESMIIDPDFVPKTILSDNNDQQKEICSINQNEETTSNEVETEKSTMVVDNNISECSKPKFRPAKRNELRNGSPQFREIPVPRHRFAPLLKEWKKIYEPLVKHLNLQVRMNLKSKRVEIRTSKYTTDLGSIQKAADFVKAFMLGFSVDDALAILRVDDLYIDSFEIKDVKTLEGDHLSRAIGRIAGKNGKVKFAIENASKTRIVLADSSIHILGSFQNIKIARDAIVSLILGSPPGKVNANLAIVSSRMKQRF
ncbi:pre-rRNA-processing protein PNO1 [Gigaspora margarita]|uniref:Pre-rRNA-processing protein PNO1 n=1 Tax=Gigaspora margarita TaxID=4874 RepID=A0A8H4ANE0_GIGMA|nr:pre-rRNA-processing protein PNO1 [Gigaspora margarita]